MPSRVHAFTADGAATAVRTDPEDDGSPPGMPDDSSYSMNDEQELAARRAQQIEDAKRKAGITHEGVNPGHSGPAGFVGTFPPPVGTVLIGGVPDMMQLRITCLEMAAKATTDPHSVLTIARNYLAFIREG